MAENETTMQGAQQQPAPPQSKCTGNCMACNQYQRGLCYSQLSYYNMKMLETMVQINVGLQQNVKELKEKIEAMQNNEAMLFDPINKDI